MPLQTTYPPPDYIPPCGRSMCGWYASYWNAFLYRIIFGISWFYKISWRDPIKIPNNEEIPWKISDMKWGVWGWVGLLQGGKVQGVGEGGFITRYTGTWIQHVPWYTLRAAIFPAEFWKDEMASATDAMKTRGKNWAQQLRATGCEYFYFKTDYRIIVLLIGPLIPLFHPAGISLNSDWTAKRFIMVVYENFFLIYSVLSMTKTVPLDNHYRAI